jgi:hypothetical protein
LAAVTVFSVYPIPVTANATALAGPGTGGIKASVSLLRFELRFAKGGTIARRHFEEAEKAFSAGEFADAAGLYELSGEAVDTLAAKLNFGIAVYNSSDLPKAASILASGVQIARQKHMAILEAAFLTNLGNVRRDRATWTRQQGYMETQRELTAVPMRWAQQSSHTTMACSVLSAAISAKLFLSST